MPQDARRPRTGLLVPGILLIAASVGLGIALEADTHLLELDARWARGIVATRGPVGDAIALAFDRVGGGVIGIVVVPLLIAAVLLARRHYRTLIVYLAASLASGLAVQIMKHLFARERPEHMIVISDFGSFPSGHTANAATAAALLVLFLPRAWAGVAAVAYVLLMAVCRTYVGAHWLTDTIGGVLVGAGVALLVVALADRVAPRPRENPGGERIAPPRNTP